MKNRVVFNFQQEIERLKELFGFDFVGIALVQTPERQYELRWTYVTGHRNERYRRIKLQSGKGLAGLVFKTGKPMFVGNPDEDWSGDNLFNYPIIASEGLKSFGAIPLYKYNRVKGVILVGYRTVGKLTSDQFEQFKQEIGAEFGPYYNKEMVSDES
ncbi:GAF domain-containing protein [Sporosarcina sp. ACRSL]|uniref:GAF domain-containing protein n=1 Tax=Sporosarcina sp. ACRSL TaxID=2918215 RepID=UPI001EF6B9AC|nr:GAF domain-containing protein [Sporosarcina sp. ACRSL]MCG7343607.1 GAF domain-containing protein [Sporosarcina sp. ACRSL]